jgi:hypothetical protein
MGTGKMKIKFIILFLILPVVLIYAQKEFVNIEHPVYRFLERMENRHLISGYNSFDLPKTRSEIENYLQQISADNADISKTDKNILNDLKQEFILTIDNSGIDLENHSRIISGNRYNYFSEDEKFLWYRVTPDFNLFINLTTDLEYIHSYKKEIFNNNALSGSVGGIIRGTIHNKFGFFLKGSNGVLAGNKEAAFIKKTFRQNFKLNELSDERFFDDTEGYITADFDLIRFKLGRDRLRSGYGNLPVIDNNSPYFDYLGMSIKYDFFSYNYYHAEILDIDPSQGLPVYTDKYVVYHRLGFNLNRHIDFGAGEYIVYGRRGLDLSYLNPFAFYKTIEHANRDRDNSMLFFDINNNTLPGTKFHFMLLIDDISYGKIGNGWYGNQVMLNTGFLSSDILNLPLDISADYRRIEPYTFTHRLSHNSFTNFDYSLGSYNIPNSELLHAQFNYRLNYRLEISSSISYIRHGANPVSPEGVINVGGDINLGHRDIDSQTAKFLDGEMEYFRIITLSLTYEPLNQLFLKFYLTYLNNSQTIESHKEIQSFFTLTTIF